ncbi:hypothetical protein BGZ58_006970 [Dissophora ornata]|nr:hypothetical protein BGZ58_006970 [Dissophora ornata]
MSTTRRVVSTIINVGQHGDINHRKESTVTTTVVAAKGVTCKADRSVWVRMKLPAIAPTSGSKERTRQSSDVSSERTETAVVMCNPVKPASNNKEAYCPVNNVDSGAEESFDQSATLPPTVKVDNADAISEVVDKVQDESTGTLCRDLATLESCYLPPSLPRTRSPLLEGSLSNNDSAGNEAPSCGPQGAKRLAITTDRLEFHYPSPSPSMTEIPHNKDDEKELRDNAFGSSQVELLVDSDNNIDDFLLQDFDNGDTDRYDGIALVSTFQQTTAHTQGDKFNRTGVLAVLEETLPNTPLIRVKDPSVMLEVMAAMKERRNSSGLTNAPSIVDTKSSTENEDDSNFDNDSSDNNNDTRRDRSSVKGNVSSSARVTRIDDVSQSNMSTSPATARISLQAKRMFLQLQETRRTSVLKARQVSATINSSSSSSTLLPAPDAALTPYESYRMDPKNTSLPTYRVSPPLTPATTSYMAIPPKAATVLKGLGYPLVNIDGISGCPIDATIFVIDVDALIVS